MSIRGGLRINRVRPARGQLNRKKYIFLSPFAPENLVSRDGFGSPVSRQPVYIHIQAESGAYTYGIPPNFRGGYLFKPPYSTGPLVRMYAIRN